MTTVSPPQDIILTVRSMRNGIEAFSDEAERIGRLPDGLVQLLRENGIFGMARPAAAGGRGLDVLTTMRIIEEISIADASTGWCSAIGSGSIGDPALPPEGRAEVYRPGVFVAGVSAPGGRAIPVDGGYRVTGTWPYASGCHHADWIVVMNVVMEGERPRVRAAGGLDLRVAVVPRGDIEILDTWHVSGLRGTGSNDIAVHDVFVPEARTAAVGLGAVPQDGEYRLPMFTLFGLALAPVAFGAARRAIDELVAMAQGKTPAFTGSRLLDKPVVQYEIARAEGMLSAARAYLYQTTADLLDRASRREEIDIPLRARIRLALAQSTDLAAQAVDIAYRLGGGTSNYETSVLQRCFRDVHAVTQHFILATSNYEMVGRVLLGLDPGTPIL